MHCGRLINAPILQTWFRFNDTGIGEQLLTFMEPVILVGKDINIRLCTQGYISCFDHISLLGLSQFVTMATRSEKDTEVRPILS